MIRLSARFALPLVLLAGCNVAPATIAATPSHVGARARVERLTIATAAGSRAFKVEVAATPEEQERGLMFRPTLPDDHGMIFPFPTIRVATFWMKNTPSTLDLLFIRADGSIARIAANATPNSLDLIDSGEPVAAVLEIAGGVAARRGIAEGDRVIWHGFPKAN